MSNDFELNIINNVLKKNVSLNKNFLIKHKIFSHLAEEKKELNYYLLLEQYLSKNIIKNFLCQLWIL